MGQAKTSATATPLTPVIVVGGVSGCGKSTVGTALAARIGARFIDGDDFHPPANVAKMAGGTPLTDDDRRPWLDSLNAMLRDARASATPIVLACSALRRAYRDRLCAGIDRASCIMLVGSKSVLEQRVANRRHRYMPASLLASQIATLEPIDATIEGTYRYAVDIDQPVELIIDAIVALTR